MEYLKFIGPTLLLIIGGIITWLIQNRIEKLNKLREDLLSERRDKYLKILEPTIKTLSQLGGGGTEKAIKQIKSFDYKKTAFELNLYGSDDVVNSFNKYMEYFYNRSGNNSNEETKSFLIVFGNLLLSIRKDLGNKKTKLKRKDMLRSFISDVDNFLE